MEWMHFEDGTVRVRSNAGDAYVHTDRSILRFDLPGGGARFYYHGPLQPAGDAASGGDPLTIRYDDEVVRKLVYPVGTPIERLHRTRPISESWTGARGEEIPHQDPRRYPFDLLWRPPAPPGWMGLWPY